MTPLAVGDKTVLTIDATKTAADTMTTLELVGNASPYLRFDGDGGQFKCGAGSNGVGSFFCNIAARSRARR